MVAHRVWPLLADHVRLTVEGIDRMYLNVYVPRLECAYGAVSFFRDHRGQPLASSVLMSPMSRRFVTQLDRFVARHRLSIVSFGKGQGKDDVMAERLRQFQREEGIVFIGKRRRRLRSSALRSDTVSRAPALSVDRQVNGDGEPLLHLCRRP
jgi:hypothetical protein